MQTPYLIIRKTDGTDIQGVEMKGRTLSQYGTPAFDFWFFPPEHELSLAKLADRVFVEGSDLYYEDGFMLRYPDKYVPSCADKKELFDCPSYELDGFFSRIAAHDDTVTIDGSGLYLQTLCSYQQDNWTVFSNNYSLLVDFLMANHRELTVNDDFFANHFFNYSLAYYTNAGTPYQEISYHDSLHTIEITQNIEEKIYNKFNTDALARLKRAERIEHLHSRLSHVLDQYCEHLDLDVLGHNFTGGRDSRTSFAMFMEKHKDKLDIRTGGFNYMPDRVISNYVANRFSINARELVESSEPTVFDYQKVMDMKFHEELFIPMFRKINVTSKFDEQEFIASGYLGNVLTFAGTDRNQIMRDNRYKLSETVQSRLEKIYDEKIANLRTVYGDSCFAMFNIMYNTTNKIASLTRRLKFHTFCIFEIDILQACYLLEDENQKKNCSLHFELLKKSNPELLNEVPFEHNKSFDGMDSTFELQGFREAGNPRLYKKFLEENFEIIFNHLNSNRDALEFLSDSFYDLVEQQRGCDIPPLTVNKIYAALGTLEFKGLQLQGYTKYENKTKSSLYTQKFFEGLYLERQIYANGLAGMCYSPDIIFKTFVRVDDDEVLRVVLAHARTDKRIPADLEDQGDGYLVRVSVPESAKYKIFISKHNKSTNTITQIYNTTTVVKIQDQNEADSIRAIAS